MDLFGFDQLLPGDGRLPALAWSWAAGQPRAADGACALQRPDGRWASAACRQRHRPACRSSAGRWTVLRKAVAHRRAAAACQDAGLRFATPRTGAENQAVLDAATGRPRGVWLSRREGFEKRTKRR